MENKSNKAIVLAMYKHIIGQCDIGLIDTYISDTYIQHSPTVKDGKQGLAEMIAVLKSIPRAGETVSPIVRTIEDGAFVAVHLDVTFMGKRMAVLDIFRLYDGKLAEHWDAVQECPLQAVGEITMANGSTVIEQHGNTAKNKLLTQQFCNELFFNKNEEAANQMLAASYIEHDLECLLLNKPGVTFLHNRPNYTSIKTHRILGEGNFTVTQSGGIKNGVPIVFYDVFRVEHDMIAEHWSVEQAIPAQMAHTNGMI